MVLVLEATPGSATANTYITLAEADVYLEDTRLHTTTWTALSDADKNAALAWATQTLDVSMDWYGYVRTTTQALRFPRSGIYDLDGNTVDYDTIPTILANATAELAAELAAGDVLAQPGVLGLGMSRIKVDEIELDVDSQERREPVSSHIALMLAPLGTLYTQARVGGRTVPVVRG